MQTTGKVDADTVDNSSTGEGIADVFVKKYQSLYTSVPTTAADIDCVTKYVNGAMDVARLLEYKVHTCGIVNAVKQLRKGKGDGNLRFYSAHIIHA